MKKNDFKKVFEFNELKTNVQVVERNGGLLAAIQLA